MLVKTVKYLICQDAKKLKDQDCDLAHIRNSGKLNCYLH